MRRVIACAVLFAAALGVNAQGSVDGHSAIEVLKHNWEKVRIDWMKDPLGENFYEMRTRVSTERRGRSAMEERNVSAAREEKQKPTPPPRYIFEYKVSILNNSAKKIKELDWDYVFLDAISHEVLGLREFTSVETVDPGKRKELKVSVSAPPTHKISVHNLGKNERDGMNEKVVIRRVLFDDGSVWQ
jgi:hypothetical protein